ncbi:MAG: nucleotidyl transferase AbiEii/AbiGii toxin family protein [Deltaproteobacteria bacterium]|nr:nucleotidyl transferase AbiEii/AbiGii toxin family protein [Deltaproteobacteria bacterium]
MAFHAKPNLELAKKTLPPALYHCLEYFFQQNIPGLVLVGGTALSGFYAGHRRSDDLDLFTKDPDSQKASVLAAKSLVSLGVKFTYEFQTLQYYKAVCIFKNHSFTIDVVCDEHLFRIGHFETLSNGISVALLQTLLAMKASTLVSRCSEKDLYDLLWLFDQDPNLNLQKLIDAGQKIDGGVNGEAMLLVLSGTKLNPESCNFSLDPFVSAADIYENLIHFQKELVSNLRLYLENQPTPPLKDLIKAIKKLTGR